ncbi:MAG: YmfQ family protein [Firmicutes bacterium]|nr:YmfQ family protein [Bacillota bacterium]
MLKKINKLNAEDPMVQEVVSAIEAENAMQANAVNQTLLNMFFDTCSIAMLELYEKECGITQPATKEEDRRAAVEAKWKTSRKCDLEFLRLIADSWQYGKTSMDYTDGKIVVTFADKGIPTDLGGLKSALEEAKPAHIPIEYVLNYNTWDDLKVYTWNDFKNGTWDEIKEKING